MKRKSHYQRMIEARVQNAVYGFQIPMLSIPKLYDALTAAAMADKSDAELVEVVAAFPGVERSSR